MSDDCVPMLHWNWCATHDYRWETGPTAGPWWVGPVCIGHPTRRTDTPTITP